MSGARALRDKAVAARRLATQMLDHKAREGLEALARKYDLEADEIDREGRNPP